MIPNTVQVVGLGALPTSSIGFVHGDLERDMGADGLHSGLVLFHFRSNEVLVGIKLHQQLRCESGADTNIFIYIYIYKERERDFSLSAACASAPACVTVYNIYLYIYIYIYIYIFTYST